MNQEFDKIAKGNKRVYNSNVQIRTRELNQLDIIACLKKVAPRRYVTLPLS